MFLVVTAIQWCVYVFVVALNSLLAREEGHNFCSVLIDQLICSGNPMVTIGVLVNVCTRKEQCARRE
jgi:hypothetical protein